MIKTIDIIAPATTANPERKSKSPLNFEPVDARILNFHIAKQLIPIPTMMGKRGMNTTARSPLSRNAAARMLNCFIMIFVHSESSQ